MQELIVDWNSKDNYYFIIFGTYPTWNCFKDHKIASLLGLDYNEYCNILFKHGGFIRDNKVIFWTQRACMNARDELDLYLTMKKLS